MNLHEFQAKEFFELYDLPVSKRSIITKKEDIKSAFSAIDSSTGCVAKVQAHTGGRGKVGGVKVCKTIHEVELFVEVGEEVDITAGPFVSMTGSVVEVDVKNRKVKVGVKLFGITNTVDLDFNHVQKSVPKNEESYVVKEIK